MIRKMMAAALVLAALLSAAASAESVEPDYQYIPLGQGIYRLGNTGYLVNRGPSYLKEKNLDNVRRNAEELNRTLPLGGTVKKYVYFVESSRSADLSGDLRGENQVYSLIREHFEADGIGTLALESQADYMNWFYQTDHHWNYKGSYQGYCDLVRMIFGEEEPLEAPAETVVFEKLIFHGSYCKHLQEPLSTELFTVYRFDGLPDYRAWISGDSMPTYGRAKQYFKGKYKNQNFVNHYGNFYGGDTGEVMISTNQTDKPNLLLIGNSYDNALLLLLSRHFNNIYAVDLRHYQEDMGRRFRVMKYCTERDISVAAMVGDGTLFYEYFTME